MTKRPLILVVDDDPHLREVVRFALAKAGFDSVEAEDGEIALARIREREPDLIVLDVLMPEMDGAELCRRVRATSAVPIVFLSSKDDEVDRIVGLELGGDDYVTKPFSPRELVARIKAVLRRSSAGDGEEPKGRRSQVRAHGRLRLDRERFQAFWGTREITLTVTEFGLLETLLGYPGKVYSRDELVHGAWSDDGEVAERTIDSHVRRLRAKFARVGGDPIETVHGMGYKLGPCQ